MYIKINKMSNLRIEKGTQNSDMPKDVKIKRSETTDIRVAEIENGFLINKEMKVFYDRKSSDGKSYEDYSYVTKTYFSSENPL